MLLLHTQACYSLQALYKRNTYVKRLAFSLPVVQSLLVFNRCPPSLRSRHLDLYPTYFRSSLRRFVRSRSVPSLKLFPSCPHLYSASCAVHRRLVVQVEVSYLFIDTTYVVCVFRGHTGRLVSSCYGPACFLLSLRSISSVIRPSFLPHPFIAGWLIQCPLPNPSVCPVSQFGSYLSTDVSSTLQYS